MAITNKEKQERFRKKEELKKFANRIFRDWQIIGWRNSSRTPEEVQKFLDLTVDLSSGWNKDDYNNAWKALQNFQLELYDNPHLLQNDVYMARDSVNDFRNTPNPKQYIADQKKALQNVKALSAHIIAAMDLAGGTVSDNAAALIDVVRFIGRSLVNETEVPKSNATAMCLASIGQQYERPDWFIEELTQAIGSQLGKEMTHRLGKNLMKF